MPRRLAALATLFAPLALTVFLVAACSSAPPPPPQFADIRFTNKPPIVLRASIVDIRDEYEPPFKPPFVEQTFPIPPARAVANWARDRLKATDPSSPQRVRVTITDASVKEIDLRLTPGLRGAFTKDQSQRYDASVALRVDLLDDHGSPVRSVTASATRSRTVAEDITLNDRDRVFYTMTEQLMQDLDQDLDSKIRGSFDPYVVS